MRKVKIYGKVLLASIDSMLHANIVLDNRGYKQTLGMCNIFCRFLLDNCSRTQLSLGCTCIVSLVLNIVLGLARRI
jgi:hypothetical protein